MIKNFLQNVELNRGAYFLAYQKFDRHVLKWVNVRGDHDDKVWGTHFKECFINYFGLVIIKSIPRNFNFGMNSKVYME